MARPDAVLCMAIVFGMLAGCAVSVASAAGDGLSVARERAAQWAPDAQLSQIVGVESPTGRAGFGGGGELTDLQDALVPAKDGKPGDGRAPAWLYRFESESGSFAVIVRGGSVTHASSVPADAQRTSIATWSVDSVAAAEIALSDAAYLAASKDGVVMQLAATPSGVVAWQLVAGTATVYVDAATAAILAARDAELAPLPLHREAGATGGTIAIAGENPMDRFTMNDARHQQLTIAFFLTQAGVQSATATIQPPEGPAQTLTVTPTDPAAARSVAYLNITPVPDGAYDITYTLDLGASVNYQLHWCADGMPVIKDPNNVACSARPEVE